MNIERLAYFFFGNNLIIGPHIRRQLRFLKEVVPQSFLGKQMDDLGCGDGKVTVLLKEVFQPTRLRGFDIHAGLIKRARSRGVDAGITDLDKDMPEGELAVLWGVLHHLQDRAGCLRRVKENYPLVFIREPVKNSRVQWLELGNALRKEEIEHLVIEHLPGAKVHYCGNSILVFYQASGFSGSAGICRAG